MPSPLSTDSAVYAETILPFTEGLTGVNLWLNNITSDALYATMFLIGILILLVRAAQVARCHLRLLTCLNLGEDQQRYWMHAGSFLSKLKKHILVAPLIHRRHNKEIQLSAAINVGTLPSRIHALFLSLYLLSNLAFCLVLDYCNQPRAALLAEARGRTGHLAVMNMIPLFLFAARNNPLIPLLGISFDTFNLFHRWIGRLVITESIAHTFLWGSSNYDALGFDGLTQRLRKDLFLIYGLISVTAMLTVLIQSISFIRHAFYEIFLHLHQLLVVAALAGLVLHCEEQNLPQKPVAYALISMWCLERLTRLVRIFQHRGTRVEIKALPGGACRMTFHIRRSRKTYPGHHVYAYIPSISLWMSHPFSVAWAECDYAIDHATVPTSLRWRNSQKERPSNARNSKMKLSCVIAARTGMTAALYKKASLSKTGIISLIAFLEGPYGGLESLRSYGTVLLFAGGVGITHQVSHLRDLVNAFDDGTCATRKVTLVWSVRLAEQFEWVRKWMEELLEISATMGGFELKLLYFVTQPNLRESTVGEENKAERLCGKLKFGRPDVDRLLQDEFHDRAGAMCVGVCGPGALADDVRSAARGVMGMGNVDFWEEAFTW